MELTCTFYGHVRVAIETGDSVRYDVPADSTVGDVLDRCFADNPRLEDALCSGGELRDSVRITVNTTHIAYDDGLETAVADGDELRVFPPVTGG